jgi:hypothetical protein
VSGTLIFVTDYGLADGYAAELWAAAWSASPGVRCIDGTHLIPAGDVLTAAYRCKTLARAFGPGSVICAVVDPGVGGDRAAVAVECDGVACVAPDTGLVSYLWLEARQRQAARLITPAGVSPTFHGRDLFAPVAALIAAGRSLAGAGVPIDTPHLREELTPVADGDRLRSLVVSVDHFGNCITGVRLSDVGERRIASLSWPGGESDRVVTTYAEIDGTVAALWNSSGHLELAAREASAAERARIRAGMPITVALR